MTADATAGTAAGTTTKKKETERTTVTMNDGRMLEFAGKQKVKKEGLEGTDGKYYVRMDFINGETRMFEVPADDVWKYALHGAKQKYGDELSGMPMTTEQEIDDAVEAIDSLGKRLVEDRKWDVEREAGDSFSGASVVIKAMCEVTGKSKEDIKKYLDATLELNNQGENKLSRQQLYKALRADPRFKEKVIELEAAKPTKGPAVVLGEI